MIITVIIGQANKNIYDAMIETKMEELVQTDTYVELGNFYIWNLLCMFADCFNII